MLSHSSTSLSVARLNLFTFFIILCDIPTTPDSNQNSCFEEEASGLAVDDEEYEEPLIVI